MAWMLDGQTLAIGGQSRNIQLYDMKVSGTNVPPISAHAHNFGVHGIEVCPHRPYLMATFCRSVGEPVKLWDIRRMDSVVSEIKMSGSGTGTQASSSSSSQIANQGHVEAVKWAILEPGTLSVAIGDSVQDYDTNSGSRPALIRVNHANRGQPIKDIALYGGPRPTRKPNGVGAESKDQSGRLIEALYPRRMLAVLGDRTICDMAKHTYAPVAISRRDGRLVHALGASVWVGSTTFGK
jgi:WD40 repeat protein